MHITNFKKFLLTLPRPIKRLVAIFFDIFFCVLSVWLAFGLRLDVWSNFDEGHLLMSIFAVIVSIPIFIFFGLYRAIFRYIGTVAFLSMVRVFFLYAAITFFIFAIIRLNAVPWSIGIIQPILLFIIIGSSRYFVRYWLSNLRDIPLGGQCVVLIYGAGSAGRQLASSLYLNKKFLICGFIDDDPSLQGATILGMQVYSRVNLQQQIHRLQVTDILLAIPSVPPTLRREIISSLSECGVRVRTVPSIVEISSSQFNISELHNLNMDDLLGRLVVMPDSNLLERNIRNKIVVITGAGGSIGSELSRQIINLSPSTIILIDHNEHSLYSIYEELKKCAMEFDGNSSVNIGDGLSSSTPKIVPYLASVRDRDSLLRIFRIHQPYAVFHAAAYKHVPLVEQNPVEGIRNNVYGTLTCAQVSLESGVSHFTLVSTDKAVRPTNIMGASKRVAELILQAIADSVVKNVDSTIFSIVRFGNVLGSSGSVVPLFRKQIAAGGPITLTDLNVTRYFMTIPEAAQLVIQASTLAVGGNVFVLDMGEPVRIYDLAVRMIYLSGLLVKDEAHPHGDIEILLTGLRPGEKLYEELLIGNNPQPTSHPKIMKAHEEFLDWENLQYELEVLNKILDTSDTELIQDMLKKLVEGYQPESNSLY